MTQAEVAAKAGVTVETVARLERVLRGRASANANPSLETLARLAYAVGIEPLALLRDVIRAPETDELASVLLMASQEVRDLLAALGRALIDRERQAAGKLGFEATRVLQAALREGKKKPAEKTAKNR